MKTYLLKLGFTFALIGFFSVNQLWAFTAVTSGDWSNPTTWGGVAPGTNVTAQDIIIPNGITVDLDVDVLFNGLLNQFSVDGVLNSTTNNGLTMESGAFAGDGDIDIQRLEFNLLATSTFTGTLVVNELVNDGALLNFTSDITVSDTLNLAAGTITLGTGANLAVQANSTVRRDDGTLVVGGGIFNSGANYHLLYVGTSKTTGVESNSTTIQNVFIQLDNNGQTVTLGNDLEVNGTLQMNTGILAIGANELVLNGNLNVTTGSMFNGSATSTLTIESSSAINNGIEFTAGSSLDKFTIDHTGTGNVKLMSQVTIISELELMDGDLSLESGSEIIMSAGTMVHVENGNLITNGGAFTGTAAYDVEYMGSAATTSGLELTGTGLNDVEVNLSSGNLTLDDDATINGELFLRSGKMNLDGNNLILNGTLEQNGVNSFIGNMNSDLTLNITTTGDDTLYFDASNLNIAQLTINTTGGDIVLYNSLHIHDELILTSGSIIIRNDVLTIEQNADISGYDASRYIKIGEGFLGKLEMYVNANDPYLTFPVGTEDTYSPAYIQQQTGATSGMFKVGVFEGVFTGGDLYAGYNSAASASIVNRTWLVESSVVTLNMNLKLGWLASDEINGFDRTNAHISHFTAGAWDTYAPNSAVSGSFGTYEITRTGLSTLSPFAVADENAELIVEDEEAGTIKLFPNPCTDVVNIQYTNVADQYVYQIMDITGKTHTVVANGTNTFDVSGLDAGFYFLTMTNMATQKTTVKEFIKK